MLISITIAVIAVLLTIILLIKGINLGFIMLIDCVFIAIWSKMSFENIAASLRSGIFSEKTLGILFILILVMMLEDIMRNTGMIKQIADNTKQIVKNNLFSSAMLPVFLGLLPSPGGARFSCPMVEEILGKDAESSDKAFINYWFRHVWRDGFILYPGAILASQLANIPTLLLFVYMLPFCILHAVIGFIIVYGKVKKGHHISKGNHKEIIAGFIGGIFPIVIIIGLYIVFLGIKPISDYALYLASAITVAILVIYKKYTLRDLTMTFRHSVHMNSVILVLGVMIFMQFLTASGLVDIWLKGISYYGIPKEILFIILPFIAGALSGITVSFVSLSFPILINMGLDQNIWFFVAAYIAGFSGVMITPVHLCSAMTSDYFGIKTGKLLKKVIIAEAVMLIAVVVCLIIVRIYQ
jgi:integral membrane protein (TIGR00529 family)